MIVKQWEQKFNKKVGKTYKNNIGRFLETCNFDALNANYSDIVSYLDNLRKTGISPKNLKNHLLAIKFYYRCLVEIGYLKNHPCRGLLLKDRVQKDIDLQRLYTAQDINDLLERKFEKSKENLRLRNKIIVQLLVHQALKTNELTSLKTKDIDLENAQINIQNSRILKLKSEQIIPLFTYLKEHKKDHLLTTKNGNPIANATVRFIINYGYEKVFIPLKIRQTTIHLLLKKGEQLRKVQIFAGHKYISSTQQYLGDNLDALKSVIQKKHPL